MRTKRRFTNLQKLNGALTEAVDGGSIKADDPPKALDSVHGRGSNKEVKIVTKLKKRGAQRAPLINTKSLLTG